MADSAPTINPLLFEGEHLVRTVEKDGQPWFVAADVCRVLGVKNVPDAVSKLDEDEKGIASIDTLGGTQALRVDARITAVRVSQGPR